MQPYGSRAIEKFKYNLKYRRPGIIMNEKFKVVRLNCKNRPLMPKEEEILKKAGIGIISISGDDITNENLDADAVMVEAAKLPADVIRKLSKCKIIARIGIGVDKIDINAATDKGIIVTNVPDFCKSELADHTMALILALARRLLQLDKGFREKDWGIRRMVNIQRLDGKIIGFVGFGRLAIAVAERAKAFGLKIFAYDPYVSEEAIKNHGGKKLDSLEKIFAQSDIVTLHLPLAPETFHLIGEDLLKKMKPTAILINTARGAIVDEPALVKALQEDWIAGAGLDVFENMDLFEEVPTKQYCPFFKFDNVIVTPHSAPVSVESIEEVTQRAAQEVVRALSGLKPKNIVNPEVMQKLSYLKD
jgi:D-3-phosphoglycerate dehydrogenase / 2-oxoglutarate reductase